MKRVLVVVLAALAMPCAAQAKELTGVKLCGASGCAEATLTNYGHEGPFDAAGAGMPAPPPGVFYVLRFEVDGHPDAWTVFYEPRSGLAASRTEQAWMTWNRLRPELAKLVEDLATKVEAFPRPTVTRVRIGGRDVSGDPGSYLRLFELDAPRAVPASGDTDIVDLEASRPNPWTDGQLLYYPADNVVQLSAGRTIRLPGDVADDLEAARPLSDARSRAWTALAFPLAGAGGLVAALLVVRRRRPRG